MADRGEERKARPFDKRWVRNGLMLFLALAVGAVSYVSGLGLLVSAIVVVVARVIAWSVESRVDTRLYKASRKSTGVPWQCDLDGRRFPSHQAALDHAQHEHPERDFADARTHLSVAGGLQPTS